MNMPARAIQVVIKAEWLTGKGVRLNLLFLTLTAVLQNMHSVALFTFSFV